MARRQVAAFRFVILHLLTCLFLELQLGVSQVSSSNVAPKSVLATVAKNPSPLSSDGSQAPPPPPPPPPPRRQLVGSLGKMFDDQIDELAQDIQNLADEEERATFLKTLLVLSEYMIYGGHEQAHCDKLVQWMDTIFGQDSSLCQSIDGQFSINLHETFQSPAYQVFFKKKFDFTEHNIAVKPSVAKEITRAEKATVLENAQRLASIIDSAGDGGHSLYVISVMYTYWNIHEDLYKDTSESKESLPAAVGEPPENGVADIPKSSFNDNSKNNFADGKVKGGLSALSAFFPLPPLFAFPALMMKKHPKYGAASLVAGGLALGGFLGLMQPSATTEGTPPWNETEMNKTKEATKEETKEAIFLPGTIQNEAKVDVPLLLAWTCFFLGAGSLGYYAYDAYYASAPPNVQQTEVTESTKEKTAKQSEKKAH